VKEFSQMSTSVPATAIKSSEPIILDLAQAFHAGRNVYGTEQFGISASDIRLLPSQWPRTIYASSPHAAGVFLLHLKRADVFESEIVGVWYHADDQSISLLVCND